MAQAETVDTRESIRELICCIAKALVDNPAGVTVAEIPGHYALVFELQVDRSDVGKVIGKGGRLAKAIRALLSAAGRRYNLRVKLEIVD